MSADRFRWVDDIFTPFATLAAELGQRAFWALLYENDPVYRNARGLR